MASGRASARCRITLDKLIGTEGVSAAAALKSVRATWELTEHFDADKDDVVGGEVGDVKLGSAAGKVLGAAFGFDLSIAFGRLASVYASHLGETAEVAIN